MKEVWYLHEVYEVPDWVKFIAADDSGTVWAYDRKPGRGNYGYLTTGDKTQEIGFIGRAGYPLLDIE